MAVPIIFPVILQTLLSSSISECCLLEDDGTSQKPHTALTHASNDVKQLADLCQGVMDSSHFTVTDLPLFMARFYPK